jgi:hypothetical protein
MDDQSSSSLSLKKSFMNFGFLIGNVLDTKSQNLHLKKSDTGVVCALSLHNNVSTCSTKNGLQE